MSTPLPVKTYAPHLRLTMLGSLGAAGGSLERFSVSLSLQGDGGVGLIPTTQTFVDDLANDCRNFWVNPATGIGSRAKLDEVKVASIGSNGKYTRDPMISVFTAVGGTAVQTDHPFQVSLAVSLVTARRGPTGRGRIFLPMPVFSVMGGGTIGQGNADAAGTAVVALIQALNNVPGVDRPGTQVVVASSKGYNSPVTGVRVGQVLDTVRSRRTQLQEAYGATQGVG